MSDPTIVPPSTVIGHPLVRLLPLEGKWSDKNGGNFVGWMLIAVGFGLTVACIQGAISHRFGDEKATRFEAAFVRRFRLAGPALIALGVFTVLFTQ